MTKFTSFLLLFLFWQMTNLYGAAMDSIAVEAELNIIDSLLKKRQLREVEDRLLSLECHAVQLEGAADLKCELYIKLRLIAYTKFDYPLAHYYNKLSFQYAIEGNNLVNLATAHRDLGLNYYRENMFYEACQQLNAAIEVALKCDEKSIQSSSFNALGLIYKSMGIPLRAAEYYKKGIEVANAAYDTTFILLLNLNLIEVYLENNENLPFCEQQLESLQPMVTEFNNPYYIGGYYRRKAKLYKNKDPEAALKYAQLSLEAYANKNFNTSKLSTVLTMADVLIACRRPDEAMKYLNEAKEMTLWQDSLALIDHKALFYELSSKCESMRENYSLALAHNLRNIQLTEKIVNQLQLLRIDHMNAAHQDVLKNNLLLKQRLEIKNQLQDLRISSIRLRLFVSLGLVFGLLLVIALLINSRRKKKMYLKKLLKFNTLLEQVNKDKSDFIDNFAHEFRTPLYTNAGVIQLIRQGSNRHELESCLKILRVSGFFLSNFVENLIFLNKLNLKSGCLSFQHVDLRSIIASNMDSIELMESEQCVSIQIDETIPEVLLGDQHVINLILYNLLKCVHRLAPNSKGIRFVKTDTNALGDYDVYCEVKLNSEETTLLKCLQNSEGLVDALGNKEISVWAFLRLLKYLNSKLQYKVDGFSFVLPFFQRSNEGVLTQSISTS